MPQLFRGNYRWVIVTLLFFATSINYIDRQVIGLLKPILEVDFHWNEKDYGYIVMGFQASYAVGLLVFGRFIDSIGTKLGYSISIIFWSLAAMLHALVKSTFGFGLARAALGLGESGNFPAAIKAVTEWFPKQERALATGLFNSGTNIGAVAAPLLVPLILAEYGWRAAFFATGAMGLIWFFFWWFLFEIPSRKKGLMADELKFIQQGDKGEEHENSKQRDFSWVKLFGYRQTWVFFVGKFLTDPIWWFFLFWLPDYFTGTFHLDLKKPGWPLVIVYTATSIGSVGGGYLSSYLIGRGWDALKARKTSMLIFAICVVPVFAARYISNMWVIVGLISLAAASHQAWSANIFTTVSDIFPKKAISSVVGIGGMAGAAGGILFPYVVSTILQCFKDAGNKAGGYNVIFIICAFAYIVAWIIMHLLSPKNKSVNF
ncbi:MAG TPA: MFS transporter [Puia sp.]|nr:MFS transporter [Puia sp.]